MNKDVTGFDEKQQDKRAVTATDNLTGKKRGLDVNIVNPAPVYQASPGESVVERGAALSVVKDSETDIINYIVPAGKFLVLNLVSCTGDNRAIFRLYLDGILKEDKNSWWSDWNPEFDMRAAVVTSGKVVKVTAEHYSNNGAGDFSATVKGFLVDG